MERRQLCWQRGLQENEQIVQLFVVSVRCSWDYLFGRLVQLAGSQFLDLVNLYKPPNGLILISYFLQYILFLTDLLHYGVGLVILPFLGMHTLSIGTIVLIGYVYL